MVRAKMILSKIERTMSSKYNAETKAYEKVEGWSIEFNVVTGDTAENKIYFNSSPSGQLKLYCVNPEANKQLELDKEYYIDFVPVN